MYGLKPVPFTGSSQPYKLTHCPAGLFLYAVGELFDYGVGEDFAGDALDLGAGGLRRQAVGERKGEILALAHGGDVCKPDLVEGILDGLALRIEDRRLQRDIDIRLHYP
jgi:hypothetical protein